MWTRFMLDSGTITIAKAALDPFYDDMPPGATFTTKEDGVELTLPYVELMEAMRPKPGQKWQDITRWKYERAIVDGLRGWRVTKLSPQVAG